MTAVKRLRAWACRRFMPLMVIALFGCATVAEMAIQSAVDEMVDGDGSRASEGWQPVGGDAQPRDADVQPDDARRGSQTTSIYLAGPVVGWQRGPGLFGSGSSSPYYQASLFRGQCPALLNFRMSGDRDPFGPVGRAPLRAFDVAGNLGSSPDYTRFGRVELGGLGTPQHAWYPLTLFSSAGGRCGFAGLRLISFGEERVDILHR